MIAALARTPLARLRTRRGWLPLAGWSLLAVGAAVSARTAGLGSGADHVLRGTFAFAVLPLLTYGVVAASLGGAGLRSSIRGLVAIGGVPARAALASVLVAIGASALASGVVAAAVCVIAHGSSDAPLGVDLPASFGVAVLGGAAYAAWFCAGSALGRGAMRGVLLALDFVAGASSGAGALLTPRAHVTSLLGGSAPLDVSRRTSSVVLVLLTLACVAASVQLARRAPRR